MQVTKAEMEILIQFYKGQVDRLSSMHPDLLSYVDKLQYWLTQYYDS